MSPRTHKWAHTIADWRTVCRVIGSGLVVAAAATIATMLIQGGEWKTMLVLGVLIWWAGCIPRAEAAVEKAVKKDEPVILRQWLSEPAMVSMIRLHFPLLQFVPVRFWHFVADIRES